MKCFEPSEWLAWHYRDENWMHGMRNWSVNTNAETQWAIEIMKLYHYLFHFVGSCGPRNRLWVHKLRTRYSIISSSKNSECRAGRQFDVRLRQSNSETHFAVFRSHPFVHIWLIGKLQWLWIIECHRLHIPLLRIGLTEFDFEICERSQRGSEISGKASQTIVNGIQNSNSFGSKSDAKTDANLFRFSCS